MRTAAAIAIGLLAAHAMLVWAVRHLDRVSSAACSPEFTLPGIACRFGGLGLTLLFVPLAGVLAYFAARRLIAK